MDKLTQEIKEKLVERGISKGFKEAAEIYQEESLKLQDLLGKQSDLVNKFKKSSSTEKEKLKKELVNLHRDVQSQKTKMIKVTSDFNKALMDEPEDLEEMSMGFKAVQDDKVIRNFPGYKEASQWFSNNKSKYSGVRLVSDKAYKNEELDERSRPLPRQLKDKRKEMMVVDKTGKVQVIDKKDWEVYKRKGYGVAESVNESRSADKVYKVMMKAHKSGDLMTPQNSYITEDDIWYWAGRINVKLKEDEVDALIYDLQDAGVPIEESVNESAMTPSKVQSTINKVKKQLINKWKKKGGIENFGQKELRTLKDKLDYNPYGSPEERDIARMLDSFEDWVMNYEGYGEAVNENSNDIDKKVTNIINSRDFKRFISYMNDFYGKKGVYSSGKDIKSNDIIKALINVFKRNKSYEWGDGDSVDREAVRDELLKMGILSDKMYAGRVNEAYTGNSGDKLTHKYDNTIEIELIEPTNKGWKVYQTTGGKKKKIAYFDKQDISGSRSLFENMIDENRRADLFFNDSKHGKAIHKILKGNWNRSKVKKYFDSLGSGDDQKWIGIIDFIAKDVGINPKNWDSRSAGDFVYAVIDTIEKLYKEFLSNESVNENVSKRLYHHGGETGDLIVKLGGKEYIVAYSADGWETPYAIAVSGEDVPRLLYKDAKAKKIWKKIKPMVDKFLKSNESINENFSVQDIETIKGVVKATGNLMGLRDPLKAKGFKKIDFSFSPIPHMTIKKGNKKFVILNKKHAEDPEFVVGGVAGGLLEGVIKESSEGHVKKKGKDIYVDSTFINRTSGVLPNSELKHMGYGEFYIETPNGNVQFARTGDSIKGFEGRAHKMYDDQGGKVVKELLKKMLKDKRAVMEAYDEEECEECGSTVNEAGSEDKYAFSSEDKYAQSNIMVIIRDDLTKAIEKVGDYSDPIDKIVEKSKDIKGAVKDVLEYALNDANFRKESKLVNKLYSDANKNPLSTSETRRIGSAIAKKADWGYNNIVKGVAQGVNSIYTKKIGNDIISLFFRTFFRSDESMNKSVNESKGKSKFKVGDVVNYIPNLSGLPKNKKLTISNVRYEDGTSFGSKPGWHYSFKGTNLSANETDIKSVNESINESVEPSDTVNSFFRVANSKQAKKVDKVLVDIQTANLVGQIWDVANDNVKKKLNKLDARELGKIVWKMAKLMRK